MNSHCFPPTWTVRECESASDHDQLFRFRYEEYVHKKGHFNAHADHKNRRLADPIDSFCTNFIAESNGDIIGSIRLNRFDRFVQTFCLTEYEIHKISPDIFERGCTVARAIVQTHWRTKPVFTALVLAAAKYFHKNDLRWMLVNTCTARQANDEARFISLYQSLGFSIWRKNAVVPGIGAGTVLLLDLEAALANPKGLVSLYLRTETGKRDAEEINLRIEPAQAASHMLLGR